MRRVLLGWLVVVSLLLLSACASLPRYTSLDIDRLPCEQGQQTFFYALEFDRRGELIYPKQQKNLLDRLSMSEFPVTNLMVFTHGWNKSARSAEFDYREFICRLSGELIKGKHDTGFAFNPVVVGVFWPSTITRFRSEPYPLLPISYFKMRKRALRIAETGLADMFEGIADSMAGNEQYDSENQRQLGIHLLGHSFGARMTVRALETLKNRGTLDMLLEPAAQVDVGLLNAAMPAEKFRWISNNVHAPISVATDSNIENVARAEVSKPESLIFNIYSEHDLPNRLLFSLASILNSDPIECAVGACGIGGVPTARVDASGDVIDVLPAAAADNLVPLHLRNIDATQVIFEHGDIYKGRVSKLMASLLFDDELRRCLLRPVAEHSDPFICEH